MIFHLHKWIRIKEEVLRRTKDGAAIGYLFVDECEKCGKIRSQEVMVD